MQQGESHEHDRGRIRFVGRKRQNLSPTYFAPGTSRNENPCAEPAAPLPAPLTG
ncbi:hypothetical protein Cabther_A0950 [Chloracidobacterium thermophilum B]|uniref:Uncharacterized protein n=1 Tax=Chloracidobacterium thermophilum (strain B) TaxID=981222 RepID=G2LFR3_CHLTF|nr:hypothetical protein Cabther_A0950 [Chloracidobacterium thermophilum B]